MLTAYLAQRVREEIRMHLPEAALFWTGCVYNFCHVHTILAGTPAMAAELTDPVWSIDELIRHRCQRE